MNQFEDSVKKSRHIEQEERQRKKNKIIIDEALKIREKYPTFKSHIEGGRSKIGLHFHHWEGLMLIPDGCVYEVCIKCGAFQRYTMIDPETFKDIIIGYIDPHKDQYFSASKKSNVYV
jgi:hypothetical protein